MQRVIEQVIKKKVQPSITCQFLEKVVSQNKNIAKYYVKWACSINLEVLKYLKSKNQNFDW